MVQLKGINIPVVTPFKNNEINEEGFRTIINYLIENGVHGIIPCGSTGETINLKLEERKKVAETAVDEASGRGISVIVGTGDSSTDRAIELTKHAADVGADAVLLVTPFYFTPSQEAIYEYFSAIASSVDIPILLYMVPKFTGGVEIDPQTVLRLQKYPNIFGIKMSITDIRKISTMITVASNENFKVFAGSGSAIFATLMLGGKGAVPATGNIAPKICSEIYNSVMKDNFEKARDLQLKMLALDNFLTGPAGHGIPAIKAGMEMLGLPAGIPRNPLLPVTDEITNELRNILALLDLIES
ncbi:MAG: 4-hydroxy-tetrahydrodipicolinate synthase [Promethearchaeota archaeon]